MAVRKPFHFHEPGEVPPDWLSSLHDIVLSADGYVVISPEYNRCIAPALTSTMNQFPPDSYRHKAGAIITYTVGESDLDKSPNNTAANNLSNREGSPLSHVPSKSLNHTK